MEGFYSFLWATYLLSAGLIALGFWRLIRRLKIQLQRDLLLGLLLVTLLTPWTVVPDKADLAPALFIAVLDGVAQGAQSLWRGTLPILLVYGLVVVLLLILKVAGVRGRRDGGSDGESGMAKSRRAMTTKAVANNAQRQDRPELELSLPPRQAHESWPEELHDTLPPGRQDPKLPNE